MGACARLRVWCKHAGRHAGVVQTRTDVQSCKRGQACKHVRSRAGACVSSADAGVRAVMQKDLQMVMETCRVMQMHAHTFAQVYMQSYVQPYGRSHANTHATTHSHTSARLHAHVDTSAHLQSCKHMHMVMHMHVIMQTHANSYANTGVHAVIHALSCKHT